MLECVSGRQCQDQQHVIDLGLKTRKTVMMMLAPILLVQCVGRVRAPP